MTNFKVFAFVRCGERAGFLPLHGHILAPTETTALKHAADWVGVDSGLLAVQPLEDWREQAQNGPRYA